MKKLTELPIVEPSHGWALGRDVPAMNDMVCTYDPRNPPLVQTLPPQAVVTAAERRRERGAERQSRRQGKPVISASGRAVRDVWMKDTFPKRRCHDIPDDSKLYVSGFVRFNGRICNVYSVTQSSREVQRDMLQTARRELRKPVVKAAEPVSDTDLRAFAMRPHGAPVMAHVNRKRKRK